MTSTVEVNKPLHGVVILDASVSLAGQACTQLLVQLGASVTTLAIRGSAPGLGSAFADTHLTDEDVFAPYVRRGKARVELDFDEPGHPQTLVGLLADADVVVSDRRGDLLDLAGLDPETVAGDRSAVILASITPYGRTGPRSQAPASDLTLFHGGGPGHAVPGLVPDPDSTPPLRLGSHQGLFGSGLAAAVNICAALLMRRRGVTGPMSIDFSCHEAMANNFRQSIGTYAVYGGGLGRDIAKGRGAGGTVGDKNMRCKDGYFNLQWAGVQTWQSLKELMDFPEWMEDERLADPAGRYRNWNLVIPQIEKWMADYDRELLFNLCQGHRIPCAPVNEGIDLLESEALDNRGFWPPTEDGGPRLPGDLARFSATTADPSSAGAGSAGAAPRLPLEGVRVVDFTQMVAGPHATLWLSSLGAEVIKIESPKRPDPFRMSLLKPGIEVTLNNSPIFVVSNLMKRDIAIDIATPEGQQIVRELVAEADVVTANFRPGVLDHFDLGYEDLSRVNPSIVMAAVSGYGQVSDYAAFQALGPTIQAFSGLSAATGYVGGPPESFFGTYGDVVTGQVAALTILAALDRRERTGEGAFIDVAMAEVIPAIAPEPILMASLFGRRFERSGNEEAGYAPHGCYPCEGRDRWVAIATFDDAQWRTVVDVLGLGIAEDDPRYATREARFASRLELDELIGTATRGWDPMELADRLSSLGTPAAPVRTAADLLVDEQLLARGYLEPIEQPELGEIPTPKLPWQLCVAGTDLERPTGPAPAFAEGTRELLQRVIGLSDDRWAELSGSGLVQ